MADGQRHLSFNISEAKYGTIHLATDIAITSKGLVNRPKKKYIAISFKRQLIRDFSICIICQTKDELSGGGAMSYSSLARCSAIFHDKVENYQT